MKMVTINDYGYYSLRKWDPIFWFALVRLLKCIAFLADTFLFKLFGLSILLGSREERKRSNQYDYSAHVVKVVTRGTINLPFNHDQQNFLYFHESYVHPTYILQHDNIVLMSVNTTYALFCVSDKGVCTLDTSIGPFSWANTFIAARKLIFLPLKYFHRLAQDSGNPFKNNLRISMIQNTGRCGSTLLGQILETVPNTRVMSEPFSFLNVWNLYLKGVVSLVEYEKILDSTFRVQCKKEKGIEHIIIKQAACSTATLSYLKPAYPEIKLLFNTRHPLPSLKSYPKLWNILPVSGAIVMMLNIDGQCFDNIPLLYDDVVWWNRYRDLCQLGFNLNPKVGIMRFFVFNYCCVAEQYIKNKVLYEKTILYEDLCEKPVEVIKDLFSTLDISHLHITVALEAMQKDSQKGFFGKRGSYPNEDLTSAIDLPENEFKDYKIPIPINISMQDFRSFLK